MKKQAAFIFVWLLIAGNLAAQSPQLIPYQAVARNSGGNLIASQSVGLRFTIRTVSSNGTPEYQETNTATTNELGLFSVNIGSGTIVSGTMAGITWGTDTKFLQVEIDPTGGTTYIDMGTTQFMSVPYALYAASSGGSGFPNVISASGALTSTSLNGTFQTVKAITLPSTGKYLITAFISITDGTQDAFCDAKIIQGSSTLAYGNYYETLSGDAGISMSIVADITSIASDVLIQVYSYTSGHTATGTYSVVKLAN